MKNRYFHIFLAATLLFSPFADGAQDKSNNQKELTDALNYFRIKEYEKSRDIFIGLVKKSPDKALYWFNLGNCYLMLGDFRGSIGAYRRVVGLRSPLSPAAKLYGAKAYRKLRNYDSAKSILDRLSKIDLPPSLEEDMVEERAALRDDLFMEGKGNYKEGLYKNALYYFENALSLGQSDNIAMMKGLTLLRMGKSNDAKEEFEKIADRQIDRNSRTRLMKDAKYFSVSIDEGKWLPQLPYWLFLDFSGGYDSNIYRDGYSETNVDSGVVGLEIGTGYSFTGLRPWLFGIAYNFGWDEAMNTSALRFVSNTLRAYASFDNRVWLLQLRGKFQYDVLGSDSFLLKPGIGLSFERNFGRQKVGLAYDYLNSIPVLPVYDYLSGHMHSASLYWIFKTKSIFVDPYFLYFIEDIGDLPLTAGSLPLANGSFGPGARLSWYFASMTSVSISGIYLYRDYKNLTDPGNFKRRDHQVSGNLRFSKGITANFTLYVEFNFTLNKSTLGAQALDDKNYSQFIFTGGIAWDILPWMKN